MSTDTFKEILFSKLSKFRDWRDRVPCRKQLESQWRIDCLLTELTSLVERQQMLEAAESKSALSLAEFEEFFVTCAAHKHESSSTD